MRVCLIPFLVLAAVSTGCIRLDDSRRPGSVSVGSMTTTGPTPSTVSVIGRVVDSATGAGIASASVSIADGPNAGKAAATDFGGNFILSDLELSEFTLNVVASKYESQSRKIALTANESLTFQLKKS
jgi:hypothetical protein